MYLQKAQLHFKINSLSALATDTMSKKKTKPEVKYVTSFHFYFRNQERHVTRTGLAFCHIAANCRIA